MDTSLSEKLRLGLKAALPAHIYCSLVEQNDFEVSTNSFIIRFPDKFTQEQFERVCLPDFDRVLKEHEINREKISFEVKTASPVAPQPSTYAFVRRNPFDFRYTFETFVVGSSNQFAHAACQAVAKQPGLCYNPLFIFGGAGLGKTHLLRAIGYDLFQQKEDLKIVMLTSENFTNELIQAIRLDKMKEFREKYRNGCDVLLLDDVHFLAGKERTQEEFFYTFNYLHEIRKQIVITSDRYPKDIEGLENRLKTRFEWGLVADVQPPEMETRIAILKNKAEEEGVYVADDVAAYIAQHITSNIRELEGTLHRLQAYALLTGVPISLELAHQTLKDIAPRAKHELSPDAILKLVALQFNLKTIDIRSEKRIRKLSLPRQICMYLLRKHLLMSYPEIGKFMGGKDHTTVLHGVAKIAELQKNDPEIMTYIVGIESLIR